MLTNTKELFNNRKNETALFAVVQFFVFGELLFLCLNYFQSQFFFLVALPFCFFVLNFVFNDLFYHLSLINCIVLGFCLIKYSVSPLLLVTTGNSTVFNNSIENLKTATLLMCVELLVLYFFIFIFYRTKTEVVHIDINADDQFNHHITLNLLLIVAVAFVFFVLLFLSESRTMFKSIFSLTEETFTWDNTYEASGNFSGSKRVVLTLFTLVFKSVRIILPLLIIYKISKLGVCTFLKLVLSITISAIQFLFITSTIAEAFIAFLILVYFITVLYPKARKHLVLIATIFVAIIIIVLLINRSSLQRSAYYSPSVREYLSKVLSSYFPGVNSVAASLDVNPEDTLELFFSTFSYSIPFNTSLFGGGRVSYATLFNSTSNTTGQIPSTLGMGCTFFSSFLAPVFSSLLGASSVYLNELSFGKKNIFSRALLFFISLSLATTVGIYNSQIAFSYILNTGLVMAILTMAGRGRFLWKK